MRSIILSFLLFISFNALSQDNKIMHNAEWHAYMQLRVSSDFDSNTTATVRRLKFRINSPKGFSQHWSYKVQVLFSSWMQERLFLQDAKIGYKTGLFSFDLGQFVPKYSLQWTQPDYLIPALERAKVINALHPDGSLGIRDLGAQVNFYTKNNMLNTHFGIFNGYGIKEYRFHNNGYMISNKTTFNIQLKKYKFQIGYSLMYRKAQDLQIKNVFADSVFYTGNDIRYNFFMMFKSKYWDLQAEYINADFEGKTAYGYYILSTLNINKSQLVLSVENYKNTYSNNKEPYYRIGYNYLVKKNDIKIFLDNYFQIIAGGIKNYYASIQLQIFLKK